MSRTKRSDAPLFEVGDHHSGASGTPPHLAELSPSDYRGYFENESGEQAMFVYDRDSSKAVLYLGDARWQTPHAVVDGAVAELRLSETELLWLRACWQAATATHQEV